MIDHQWHRPDFFARDICKVCKQPRRLGGALIADCPGAPIRTDDGRNLFVTVERALVDYFEAAVPGAEVLQEASEWYAEIEGRRVFITGMALAVLEHMEGKL